MAKCTLRSPVSKHPHYRIALQQSVEFCGQLADSRYLWSGGRGIPTDDTAAAAAAGEGRGGGRVERAGSGCSSVPGRPGPNKLSTWWRCVRACVREARGVDAAASARSACPASSSQSVYAVPAAGVIVALRTSQTSACLPVCVQLISTFDKQLCLYTPAGACCKDYQRTGCCSVSDHPSVCSPGLTLSLALALFAVCW